MKTALVLACDDNFIAYASVIARRAAALSSEDFPIILASDGVSDENRRLARQFCPRISFVEVGDALAGLKAGDHHSRATFARLRLDEAVDVDRVVYLDADISVEADIAPLLHLPLKAAPVAATFGGPVFSAEVPHRATLGMSAGSPYFNAGVMVFDVKAVRQEGIFRDALRYAREYPDRLIAADQCALNAVLDGRWQLFDWRWNVVDRRYMSKPPFIRHFVGPAKPWANIRTATIEPIYLDRWRSELLESPWPDRFKRIGGPIWRPFSGETDWLKGLLYRNSAGVHGEKARARLRHKALQANIEMAAANLTLAPRFPELWIAR